MKIQFPIREMRPDRTTYKQYGPVIASDHLYMELEVPDKYLTGRKGTLPDPEAIVLTPDGIAWVGKQLADAIDKMHSEQMK